MTPAGSLCVLFLLVVTRLMSVTSDDVTLQRRTDDASIESLMTLVQQQGSVIARQEASMQAMLAQITSQEAQITSLQSTVANLTTSLSHVTSRIVQVSFMAQTTPTPISFSASGSPLKFDKVITNLGGGYHPRDMVVTTLTSVTSGDVTLQRRTDDASIESLMTLVQQQGSVIARQEASMQAMQAQITSLQSTVANLTSRIVQVSFMAQTTPSPISFSSSGSPLKFDKVITNLGGGYHPASGVFIAPVTGLYVFYVQLMKNNNGHVNHYVIELEGSEVCENSLDEPLTYDKSSCLTTVHVQSGQQVFVRHKSYPGLALEGNLWCSFAGFLLSAD